MPIVPVINDQPSNTPDAGAGGVAPERNYAPQQIQQLGATLEDAGLRQMSTGAHIALRIQEQMDDANVKAAETKFISSATDILHGDNGYMNKQGADAINAFDGSQQSLVKAKKELQDSLGSDIQKRMFEQVSQRHLVTIGGQMSAHRAQQRIEYTANESLSRADSMRSMAQNSEIGSPDQNTYVETGVKELQNALSMKGIAADSDEAKKAERQFRSQITADNVSRLMEDGKYEDASALLTEQMKSGNVEGDVGDRLRRAIRGNLTRTKNIEQSESIFAPYQDKQLRTTDLEEMLAKAGKIENPEQRQHVQDMVRAKYNEQHTMQANEYRDNLSDVVNYKAAHNGSLKGIDPGKWAQLDASDQADLMKPPAIQTDINTLYSFITKPETLTVPNVATAWGKGLLSKESFISLTEHAMTLAKDKTYVQEAGDINGRIDYFANQAGIPVFSTGKDEAQKGQEALMKYKIQQDIDKAKQQQKGKVTGEQVDQIIKRELTQQILNVPRNPYSPARLFGSKTYEEKRTTFQIPQGATGVMRGDDGKLHYTDGRTDLGVAE